MQIRTVFKTPIFAGDLEGSKSISVGTLCIFGKQYKSWKSTSLSLLLSRPTTHWSSCFSPDFLGFHRLVQVLVLMMHGFQLWSFHSLDDGLAEGVPVLVNGRWPHTLFPTFEVSMKVRKWSSFFSCEQHTFSHCMYRRRHLVSTSHMMLHAHAWLKKNCVPQNPFVIPSLVSRHVSRPATQHFVLFFTFLYFSFFHRLRLKVDHVQNRGVRCVNKGAQHTFLVCS